ncbi:MAG: FtsX-like permease family protein [Lachnospiraceae bacterium]
MVRSTTSISLMKIFGYRKKEIRKLYLDGNLITVMLSALVGIPITKIVIDALFPAMVANVACGLNLALDWWMYVGLFGVIFVLYLLINPLLMRRVNQILPAEVLKDRE